MVLAGRTVVNVWSDVGGTAAGIRTLRRALRALRPLDARALPRRLPRPAIPVRLARRLRSDERLARALGAREAARRIPVGLAELRDRLRLLDTLRAGGSLRPLRCGR